MSNSKPEASKHKVASTTVDSVQWILVLILLLFSALMPFVPDYLSFTTVGFSLAFALLAMLRCAKVAMTGIVSPNLSDMSLLLFYGVCVLTLPLSLLNDIEIGTWIRALVPFLFLGTHFFFPKIRDDKDISRLIDFLHIATCLWLMKVIFRVWEVKAQILAGEAARLTYLVDELQIPFALIGFTTSLFGLTKITSRLRYVLIFLFLSLVIWAGYRSQILLAVIVLFGYWGQKGKLKQYLVFTALGSTVIICAVWLVSPSFFDTFVGRFESINEEVNSTRALELEYALDKFTDSPIFGKGLGYPVPIEITYAGDQSRIALSETPYVTYTHNVLGYMLMNLGAIGLLFYSLFFALPVLSRPNGNTFISNTRSLAIALIALLLSMFLVQATFRQIQTNVVLALLIHILSFDNAATLKRCTPKTQNSS